MSSVRPISFSACFTTGLPAKSTGLSRMPLARTQFGNAVFEETHSTSVEDYIQKHGLRIIGEVSATNMQAGMLRHCSLESNTTKRLLIAQKTDGSNTYVVIPNPTALTKNSIPGKGGRELPGLGFQSTQQADLSNPYADNGRRFFVMKSTDPNGRVVNEAASGRVLVMQPAVVQPVKNTDLYQLVTPGVLFIQDWHVE